jgi:hypothetical protein
MFILCLSWSITNTVAARHDVLAPIIRRFTIINNLKSQLCSLLILTVSPIRHSSSQTVPFVTHPHSQSHSSLILTVGPIHHSSSQSVPFTVHTDNPFQKTYLNITFPPLIIPRGGLVSRFCVHFFSPYPNYRPLNFSILSKLQRDLNNSKVKAKAKFKP